MSRVHVLEEPFEVCLDSARAQSVIPSRQVKLPIMNEHLSAVHDATHPQVYAPLRPKGNRTSAELPKKGAADEPRADHSDGEGLARKIKGGMHRPEGLRCFVLFDDGRDVTFRRPLRDGPYVDACLAESGEKFPGHA